ncbi:hypothetical protein MKW92_022345 [Papaver armeniacum]|nr:hypothetical protein MKW92_022345 [Papaver armeniacum]
MIDRISNSVSSCLRDNFRTDAATSTPKTPGSVLRGSGVPGGQVDQFPSRSIHLDLIYWITTQGGFQDLRFDSEGWINYTSSAKRHWCFFKIADAELDSDETVVLLSAREDAVIWVLSRIAEVGFEAGAAIVVRLLVLSQRICCLLVPASICVFAKEQVPKCDAQNDEVMKVIGSLQSVQDALFHITLH